MQQTSIKALVRDRDAMAERLAELYGAYAYYEKTREVDSLYTFVGNKNMFTLKVREGKTSPEASNLLIFQTPDKTYDTTRRQTTLVTSIVKGDQAATLDIFGTPDRVISKERQIFVTDQMPFLRFYLDTHKRKNQDVTTLEIKCDTDKDDQKLLAYIVNDLKIDEKDIIKGSYESLEFTDQMGNSPVYDLLRSLPENMVDTFTRLPKLKSKSEHRLIKRGDKESHAYFIRSGSVKGVEEDVTLHPGQLVGEFSLMEKGYRTTTMIASPDLEATIIPESFLRQMLTTPVFGRKYLNWKLNS